VTSWPLPLDGFEHLAGFQRDCERQTRQALGEAAFQAAYHRGLELPPAPAVPEGRR
jgi:hypothetical protein